MAEKATISESDVKQYFIERNGKVQSDELIEAFKDALHKSDSKGKNREDFKKIVNKLAKHQKCEDGPNKKILVLRDKYLKEAGLIKDPNADGLQASILKALSLTLGESEEPQSEEIFDRSELSSPTKMLDPTPRNLFSSNLETLDSSLLAEVLTTPDAKSEDHSLPETPVEFPFSPPELGSLETTEEILQEPEASGETTNSQATVLEEDTSQKNQDESKKKERPVSAELLSTTKEKQEDGVKFREPEIPKTKLTEKEREDIYSRFNAQVDHRHSHLLSGKVKQKQHDKQDKDSDTSSWTSATLNDTEKSWLKIAAACNAQEIGKLLHSHPEMASYPDLVSGFTASHWAAKVGHMELVKLLLSHKVDINKKTHGGYTLLHLAYMHGHKDIVKYLIRHGAKENVRDNSGKLAVHYKGNALSTRRVTAAELFQMAKFGTESTQSDSVGLRHRWNTSTRSDSVSMGYGRMGSIRRASAALKNKLVKRTRSWGSVDCIVEEGYATVISDSQRKAHSESPDKEVKSEKFLMPPPRDLPFGKGKWKKHVK